VVDAATEAFTGTGKPYLQISREWIYGDNPDITGESPIKAPPMIMLGAGRQHWPTVHAADLADFFRRALEDESAGGRYIVGDGSNPTVADLTEAAAVAVGAPGAVAGSDEEARARLGDYFAEVLLLDQRAGAAKARAEPGWQPSHPTLADEFRHGSYRMNGG
jgi:nucleoside-diphosphate-sugar epimerase